MYFFQTNASKRYRERENNRNKHTREERGKRKRGDKERGEGGKSKQAKIKDWVGVLLAQECRCLQPAVYAGRVLSNRANPRIIYLEKGMYRCSTGVKGVLTNTVW